MSNEKLRTEADFIKTYLDVCWQRSINPPHSFSWDLQEMLVVMAEQLEEQAKWTSDGPALRDIAHRLKKLSEFVYRRLQK